MMNLQSDIEKTLWRKSALNALKTVQAEKAQHEEHKRIVSFAALVADGMVLSYRKRLKDNDENG